MNPASAGAGPAVATSASADPAPDGAVADAAVADRAAAAAPPGRLQSLDAARGIAIVVMLLSMNLGPVQDRPAQLIHPDWFGLTFADLFFPLFLFAVGVSMTLSRRSLEWRNLARRVGLLVALGVVLASLKYERLVFTGVLQHIAISYLGASFVLRTPRRLHLPLAAGVLLGIGTAFVLWSPAGPWDSSGTLAHAVDGALLGGFTTEGLLQSVASTTTVVAGALTGRLVLAMPDRRELLRAVLIRAACLICLGLALAPLVPVTKRLWSPSFAVLTIGTSLAWFAVALWLVDVRGFRRPAAPLIHVGMNPIAIYVLFMAARALVGNHGSDLVPRFPVLGSYTLGFMAHAVAWTALWWAFAYVLHRRRIFIKI